MGKVLGFMIVAAFGIGLILGIWWLIWLLWTWVLPQIWPTGPEAIIHPSYWLFAAMWVLLGFIANMFRHSKA